MTRSILLTLKKLYCFRCLCRTTTYRNGRWYK